MTFVQTLQRNVLASVALLSATSLYAQPASLIDAIPAESNYFVAVKNFPALEAKFNSGPMGNAWKSPEMNSARDFFDESFAKLQTETEEKIGINLTRLSSHIKGDVIFYSTELTVDNESDGKMDFILAFQMDPNDVDAIRNDVAVATEKIEEKQKVEKSSYDFQGVSVRRLTFEVVEEIPNYDWETGAEVIEKTSRMESLEYGFIGEPSVFFIANGPEGTAKSLINTSLNAEAEKMSSTTQFQTYNELIEFEGDLVAYVNLPRMIGQMKAAVLQENPDSQKGWDIFDATGFSTLEGFGIQLSYLDKGLAFENAILVPRERKGVLAALYPEDSLTLSSATLAPKNAISFRAFELDLGRLWDSIDQILAVHNPEAKMQLDQGVAFANMQMQTNILNNIVKNIAGEHAYYQVRDPKGAEKATARSEEYGFTIPEQLIVSASFATKNNELFNTALNTVFEVLSGENMGMPLVKSDFNGLTLWGEDPEKTGDSMITSVPTFGLSPKSLLISADAAEMKALARRATGVEKESLNDSSDFQKVTAPYNREFLAYLEYSSPENLPFVMQQLEYLPGASDIEDMDAMIPEPEWFKKYFGPVVAVTYAKPEAIYSQSIFYMVNE